jgi:hypothetical protein
MSASFVNLPVGATVATYGQWSWVCNGSCKQGGTACNVSLCQPVNASCRTPLPTPTAPGPLTKLCGINSGTYGNLGPPPGPGVVTASGTAAGGGTWQWTCLGNCLTNKDTEQLAVPAPPARCSNNPACIGASSPLCSSYICAPVNGKCGADNGGSFTSAPSGAGLCAPGIPTGVTGTASYSWKCDPLTLHV